MTHGLQGRITTDGKEKEPVMWVNINGSEDGLGNPIIVKNVERVIIGSITGKIYLGDKDVI